MRKARVIELLDAHTIFRRNDCEADAACHDDNEPSARFEILTSTLRSMAHIFTGQAHSAIAPETSRFLVWGHETQCWVCELLEANVLGPNLIEIRHGDKIDDRELWFSVTYSGAFVVHWE